MEIVLRYFWRHKESRALYYNQSNIIPESFENLSQETFPIFAELTKTAQAPIIGWTLIPNYKNKIYQSDNYGFRNTHTNFSSKKVVAIFGGSVAQGGFASCNEKTISGYLEKLLQKKYNDQIIVVNFAQSSYTLLQEIALFCLVKEVCNIQLSIFIDGHNDVSAEFEDNGEFMGFSKPFFGGWTKTVGQMKLDGFLKSQVRLVIRYSLFAKLVLRIFKSVFKPENGNKVNNRNLNISLDRVEKNFEQCIGVVASNIRNSNKSAIMTLQPSIYSCGQLTAEEQKFLGRFSKYRATFFKKSYQRLREKLYQKSNIFFEENKKRQNLFCVDFSRVTESLKVPVFCDDCHFEDRGNSLYAKHLFEIIKTQKLL